MFKYNKKIKERTSRLPADGWKLEILDKDLFTLCTFRDLPIAENRFGLTLTETATTKIKQSGEIKYCRFRHRDGYEITGSAGLYGDLRFSMNNLYCGNEAYVDQILIEDLNFPFNEDEPLDPDPREIW